MKPFGSVLAALLVAFSVTTAHAADDWTIVRATGQMWVQRGDAATRVSLSENASFAPGDILTTGTNTRVLLQRGQETMIVGPGTIMSLPVASDSARTTILQLKGAIRFDVEKRNVQHFEVKTPFLAAVVKGTNFTVQATDFRDSVVVSRGEVEVTSLRTGESASVTAGRSATVSGNGLTLSGSSDRAGADGGDGLSLALGDGSGGLLGGLGVSAGIGSQGVSLGIGGDSGIGVGLGGSGLSAGVGGPGGIGASVGGGNGIGVSVGGVSLGVGGN
jgi:hypothetical protein